MLDNGNTPHILDFGEPEKENSIIKVIGVGGGGGNAVNHMYREGIHDVSFVLCNTDNQALNDSPVPVHLQLGKEGLGAGNKPAKARQAAEETLEEIKHMLNDGTKMAFITAGMGGGTGTGAAPVIARVSKELGILTVGIVTIPFRFEGPKKIDQALDGVEEMSKHVDALLVINNERLRQIYPDLAVLDAFGKADDYLTASQRKIIFCLGVGGLIFVPIFKTITHLPPFVGILLVLGVLWTVTETMYRHLEHDDSDGMQKRVSRMLTRIDMSTILFFLGILMAVGCLQTIGVLAQLGEGLNIWFDGNHYIVTGIIGVLSSIVDNVPLVAGCMGMYPVQAAGDMAIDGVFWQLLAYCAGVGGSMLIIGSAAGVVVMGLEKITFGWYMKKITWVAFVGYLYLA